MADTTYTVLQRVSDTESPVAAWRVVSNDVQAPSAEFAIRSTIDDAGTYVAVPARSWKPVTVTTETKTVLKLEQPDTAA
jgi:hypothetical protein